MLLTCSISTLALVVFAGWPIAAKQIIIYSHSNTIRLNQCGKKSCRFWHCWCWHSATVWCSKVPCVSWDLENNTFPNSRNSLAIRISAFCKYRPDIGRQCKLCCFSLLADKYFYWQLIWDICHSVHFAGSDLSKELHFCVCVFKIFLILLLYLATDDIWLLFKKVDCIGRWHSA